MPSDRQLLSAESTKSSSKLRLYGLTVRKHAVRDKTIQNYSQIVGHFRETSKVYPPTLFVVVALIYLGGIFGIGITRLWVLKFLLGATVSIAAGRLFLIGHDAGHGSFTQGKWANRVYAACALSMAFHVPTAWKFWHNSVHHAFTNDLAKDFVWRPMSHREYQAAPRRKRLFEQIYRHHSGVGLGPYYFIKILAPRMLVNPRLPARFRHGQTRELSGFYIYHAIVIAWLCTAMLWLDFPPEVGEMAVNLLSGYAGPLIYVCYAIGFVVYFNHTHPEIKWTNSGPPDNFGEQQISSTVYLKMRGIAALLLPNKVMAHVAHHLDPLIPVRRLPEAQEHLLGTLRVQVKTEIWSWHVHCRIMRSCKLYDPQTQHWTNFDGKLMK